MMVLLSLALLGASGLVTKVSGGSVSRMVSREIIVYRTYLIYGITL